MQEIQIMKHTNTIIIGGGQAGLAMGRCLTEYGIEHVILERGRIGERWRSERWDSLRMLTPNWQSRLPHWHYAGVGRRLAGVPVRLDFSDRTGNIRGNFR